MPSLQDLLSGLPNNPLGLLPNMPQPNLAGLLGINEAQANEGMDILTRGDREAPVQECIPAFQHQGVVGMPGRGPPVGLGLPKSHVSGHREKGSSGHGWSRTC